MKNVTVKKSYLDQLKRDRDYYKTQYETVVKDRETFRSEFIYILKKNIEMLGKNEYWAPNTIIERMSRLLNKVETWYWGN